MSTQPIIDPIVFYKIGLLTDIINFLFVFFVVGLLVVIGAVLLYLASIKEHGVGSGETAYWRKTLKRTVAIFIVITTLLVVIPSEKTMYSMLAAETVTPANIQHVGDTAEDCIDYIFDKVEELTGTEEVDDE